MERMRGTRIQNMLRSLPQNPHPKIQIHFRYVSDIWKISETSKFVVGVIDPDTNKYEYEEAG